VHDESDFLRKLLDAPADDAVRLVYADWLDERGGEDGRAKARFLRLTVRLTGPIQRLGWRKPRQNELRQLAAGLPADWLAVVSRLKVENCGRKRAADERGGRYRRHFNFVCDKSWDEMRPTDDPAVRACDDCRQDVHYCDTIAGARQQAQRGHCVAVDLGIARSEDDLSPPLLMLGFVDPTAARDERRLEPDAAARAGGERQRRADGGAAEGT
jgi:uncharacterized protein (TIGR02996 family)